VNLHRGSFWWLTKTIPLHKSPENRRRKVLTEYGFAIAMITWFLNHTDGRRSLPMPDHSPQPGRFALSVENGEPKFLLDTTSGTVYILQKYQGGSQTWKEYVGPIK
jgi:hypothetical protein